MFAFNTIILSTCITIYSMYYQAAYDFMMFKDKNETGKIIHEHLANSICSL